MKVDQARMATTSVVPDVTALLHCPRCRTALAPDGGARLRCGSGHEYPIVAAVPRIIDQPWSREDVSLVAETSEAFGRQWVELGEEAGVGDADLLLHLPSSWAPAVFSGLVLDAGCGMGRYAALVAARGARVIGLDLSRAVDKAAQLWPDVAFVQSDLVASPFEAGTFDLVYSFGVLHHLPDPVRGFTACFDLVKPGGSLLVWVYSAHGGAFRHARRFARMLVRRAPLLRRPVAWTAAVTLWTGYLLPRRALAARAGRLGFYASKGLRQIYVDCHDALAAPREVYLTAEDCRAWLSVISAAESGFERRRDGSGWIIWARKA